MARLEYGSDWGVGLTPVKVEALDVVYKQAQAGFADCAVQSRLFGQIELGSQFPG